jgi:hypothetical protein
MAVLLVAYFVSVTIAVAIVIALSARANNVKNG